MAADALPVPHAEDVIVRRQPLGTFSIGVNASAPQIVCGSLEEALRRAASFATKQHVGLWYTTDGRICAPLTDVTLLAKIWNEYLEMPGLRLTSEQAQRLWALDAHTCSSLLNSLIDLKFLVREPDGRYARVWQGDDIGAFRMAKANAEAILPAGSLPRAG